MRHDIRLTPTKIARLLQLIEPAVHRSSKHLAPFRYLALAGPDAPRPVGPAVDDSAWEVIVPPAYWGDWDTTFTLRTRFAVPADWDRLHPVVLRLPLGRAHDFSHPEALIYLDGEAYAAADRHHHEVRLPDWACDGGEHLLALHGWTGRNSSGLPAGTRLLMQPSELAMVDEATRSFVATARIAHGVAAEVDEHEPARAFLLTALDEAFNCLDLREPLGDSFYASVPEAHQRLVEGIERSGRPLDVELYATGHAHIDVAWLWTQQQSRQKAARTFHTVLRLMEEFPEYHFTQSQPQLYQFAHEGHPALFEGIRQRVAEGRWEPIGGMWVEADCNITGAESLARQFLLGRSFFRQHFGERAESPVLWLPDAFGYSACLPQLMKQAGVPYFFTIKINWNRYNRLPYDSFWWQGLDGSRVLAHMSTTPDDGRAFGTTYNAQATPREVVGAWRRVQQKELGRAGMPAPMLMAYGHGDGGGGPTRDMLENLRVLEKMPATPRACQGSVHEFFEHLNTVAGDGLPTWNGELYFELHRGTYTSQARNKRANRKSEFLLHDAELLASAAHLASPGYAYPAEALREAWEIVCLNQFHDILPGSSIGEVYVESLQQYERVAAAAEEVKSGALSVLAAAYPGAQVLLVNPAGHERSDLALWAGRLRTGRELVRSDGVAVAAQPGARGGTWLDVGKLPPFSVTPLYAGEATDEAQVHSGDVTAEPGLLENERLRVELDAAGDITRIFDKDAQRDLLPPGALANQWQAFEDRPVDWDAWDVDIFYDDKQWLAEPAGEVRVLEAGALRGTIELHRRILNSSYVQRISLERDSARLDFETEIDWRERHTLLKAAFPLDLLTPTATYEIQWGHVQRPTHRNTSWDWARFEVPAQKWADLSEGDYGASLLNDCKYGYDAHGNVLRITLLRSPTMPDPEADQGRHTFVYSLLPHTGPVGVETVQAGYQLNDPVLAYDVTGETGSDRSEALGPLLEVDAPNVVIETVKRAEDGAGLIVRLYDSLRCRRQVTLRAAFEVAAAYRTNLLEERAGEEPLAVTGREVTLLVRPFEIVTLRVVPAGVAEGDA